jgi:trigger factor
MTIEASRLRIDIQERERWRRTLSVTVPAEVVREERERVAARLAKRLKLPGFRAGRIPASVVEKRYGSALNQEMLDRIIEEAYKEALKSQSLLPISQGEVEQVQYQPEQDLSFTISFDVHPVIELRRVGGFRIARPRVEVGDAELERVLTRLRRQAGAWRPVESGTPEEGDRVSVTVLRLENGEAAGQPRDYDLVLGEGDALPEIEQAIATLEPGTEGEFTVQLPSTGEEPGEEQRLRLSVRERKVLDLPELDDTFARSLGEFDDLEALKARIREDLRREAEEQSEAAVRVRLLDQVVEANDFDIPESMVDRYIASVLGDTKGADPERLTAAKQQLRPEGERAVRRVLVIERLADTQNLRATEAELDERIEQLAARSGASTAEVYARLQKAGRLEVMEREITEEKVFAFLKAQSEIQEE